MPKQKLTATARRMKAIRDKRAAMTADRRKKKAENQRKRRAAVKEGKNIEGKDYDHKDRKFKSIKANRGNDGKGTKKEK
jgi:regulator of protease activity HflC (stomatin/prohibitin superfamily)|tara:strand:+ start:117 stop:353 length:237 start_codon:yes stop_codon:yes gene_type:complete